MVRSPRGHDQIGPRFLCEIVSDFRIRIRQRKDNRVFRHGSDILRCQNIGNRQTYKNVGSLYCFLQGGKFSGSGKLCLYGVNSLTVFVDDTFAVAHHDVFPIEPQRQIKFRAGDCRRARTVHYQPDVFNLFSYDFQGIEQCRTGDDGGTVLVVVHDRDIHLCPELRFNLEALRGFNVFKVHSAKRRLE